MFRDSELAWAVFYTKVRFRFGLKTTNSLSSHVAFRTTCFWAPRVKKGDGRVSSAVLNHILDNEWYVKVTIDELPRETVVEAGGGEDYASLLWSPED